jgi:hypothetical protein
MSIKVEIRFTNTEDDRVVVYNGEFDSLEVTQSHMTGEMRIRPGAERHDWGRDLNDLGNKSPWQQHLEGDWLANR